MDALSALRMAGGSQLGLQAFDPAQESSAAKSISLSDLQKFGAGIAYQSPSSIPASGGDSAVSPAVSSIAAQPVLPGSSGSAFQNLLGDFVNEVSAQQSASSDAVNGLLSGKNVSLHQAMISMQEANISFQMMVEVRNKVLDSYQELMRMSV
ncbi:MAG TPA: flagellar hook-basal body complex protein FliE [Verrucomicrobiae bacterium]|jgi:flagellar hook-basal body complex protein FliE|nr:flagellar hook-basal body complex protein FliE [Verrucomicrobiae bacterium]